MLAFILTSTRLGTGAIPGCRRRDRVVKSLDGLNPDALFVAGRDWQRLDQLGMLDGETPILNLIQHVRHGADWSIQSQLPRPEGDSPVCEPGGRRRGGGGREPGPIVVIPNGIDVPIIAPGDSSARPVDLLIAGLKQPAMATRAATQLARTGRSIEVLTDRLLRDDFLSRCAGLA